jgi:hypothetical protein
VAAGSLLVVAVDVVLAPNDKQQLEPMLGKIGALPEDWVNPEVTIDWKSDVGIDTKQLTTPMRVRRSLD